MSDKKLKINTFEIELDAFEIGISFIVIWEELVDEKFFQWVWLIKESKNHD